MRSFGKMILYSCSSLKNSSLQNNTLYKYFELKEYFFPPSTLAKGEGLKEFVLFNMKDTTEYEANAFAAHLIIDDDDIYSMSKEKYDVVQMAKMLNVNINLVLIKLQELNKLGYDFRVPCEADSFFFRKPKTLTSNELNWIILRERT